MKENKVLRAMLEEAGIPPEEPPTPLPATRLWATWQRHVALDPVLAAAWYRTLSAADQATVSALTLAQCAAALGKRP